MTRRTYTVPSWVVPGTYAENLRFLADKEEIGGVELLFFLWDDDTRLLYEREASAIRSFSGRFNFSVHLPNRPTADHERLIAATADLARAWIVHPPKIEEAEAFAALLRSWRERYGDRFLLENTRTDRLRALRSCAPDMPLCMDTGHLLLEGVDPSDYARENAPLIKEIHLHGLGGRPGLRQEDGRSADGRLPDHRPFDADESWFVSFAPFLRRFEGTINIEVFSWQEVQAILHSLRSIE
jgi:sugar phosphate isomerase/epimerase